MAWRLCRYLLALLGVAATSGVYAQLPTTVGIEGEIQVARYSSLTHEPDPALSNPLAVVATVNFPRGHVNSVGDAIAYLLIRTGYRLAEKSTLSAAVQQVMDLPLPESHRRLGPMKVEAMLGVLLSEPYALIVDRLQRTIAYQSPHADAPAAAVVIDAPVAPAQVDPKPKQEAPQASPYTP
jgi:type IV pili sensor histidine kinase/response regulator